VTAQWNCCTAGPSPRARIVGAASPPLKGREQIGERHRLVAMRTWAARPDPTTEDPAILTALRAEIAGFTGWTFVDGGAAGSALRDGRRERRVTTTPGRLATGWRAHLLAAPRHERLLAHRAESWSAIVTRIVTRREGWVHRTLLPPRWRSAWVAAAVDRFPPGVARGFRGSGRTPRGRAARGHGE